jgi:uncharacterized protein
LGKQQEKMNKVYYTWQDIDSQIKKLLIALKNDDWQPDLLVGVIRGGSIPAVWMSNITGIKTDMINVSFRDNTVKHPHLPVTFLKKVSQYDFKTLIVEDINDTGETLMWIQDRIKEYKPDISDAVKYAALIDNQASNFKDLNYKAETINKDLDPAWIVFPWEV